MSLFEKDIIFNKYKADSTFASFGDDSIICNNNLGQPAFTILLQSKILFSANIIKLLIIESIISSSSINFLNKETSTVTIFSDTFSFPSSFILLSLSKMKL